MSTYTRILYQIVFHTKAWEPTLTKRNRERLFAFISGILQKKKCFVTIVGVFEDHIHIITHVHPNIAVSQLVKDIKLSTSSFIKSERLFPDFHAWGKWFGAFTYSLDALDSLKYYVLNQNNHHKKESAKYEYIRQIKEFKIEFDEKLFNPFRVEVSITKPPYTYLNTSWSGCLHNVHDIKNKYSNFKVFFSSFLRKNKTLTYLATLWLIFIIPLSAQIILNEFMIDPENDNTGEFIEIYNASGLSVDLRTFYLCDEQDTDAVCTFLDSILESGHYGLILDRDYAGEYDELIPDSIPLFTIEDARFGMYGISNSTKKSFSLLLPDLTPADSYLTGTPDWPDPGHTIERYRFSENEWNISLHENGTPGFRNSSAIKDLELELGNLDCFVSNLTLNITFTVKNAGLENLAQFFYGYIVDIPCDNNNISDTLIIESSAGLTPGDSTVIVLNQNLFAKGFTKLSVFAGFDDLVGDSLTRDLFIPLEENDLLVTEFLAKSGDTFTSEYIEVLSRSDMPISLSGVQVHDLTGYAIIDSNIVLAPDSMLVLAQSTSFHDDFPYVDNYMKLPGWRALNNNEDIIRLQNPSNKIIASLHYDGSWGIPPDAAMQLVDSSLDYHDPGNWEASYTGSPGEHNVTKKQLQHLSYCFDKDYYTAMDTLRFLAVNDGYFPVDEHSLLFKTTLTEQIIYVPASDPGDTILCMIDTAGILIEGTNLCTLVTNDPYAGQSIISFIKYYYPLSQTPLYFNEIMFDPLDTYAQVEFVELECCDHAFDLEKWQLRVNNNTLELSDSLYNKFTVLCDSDDPLYGVSSNSRQLYDGFPVLPNAGAELYLIDPCGHIMDAVDLRDHPEIRKGKSLEKQFQNLSSEDRDLWLTAVSADCMTPAQNNSVRALPGARNDLSVYPQRFDPRIDERIQFSVDADNPIVFCEILCFNLAGQCIYRHEQNVFSNPSFLHFWDGKMANGEYPGRGLYLVTALLHDAQGILIKLKDVFAMY